MVNDCLNNTEKNKLDGITKKYVDCQISSIDEQLTIINNTIDNIVVGPPPDNTDVLEYLEYMFQYQMRCCEISNKYFTGITQQLNNHQQILNKLLKCCEYKPVKPCPTKPYHIPGQAYIDITPIESPNLPYVLPKPQAVSSVIVRPLRVNTDLNPLILYPVERGYLQILSVPGSWKVVDGRIIDKSGVDLECKLPICFNYRIFEEKSYNDWSSNNKPYSKDFELVGIMGYVIKQTNSNRPEPLLIYETFNHRTGARRTFEGSIYLWHKYAR